MLGKMPRQLVERGLYFHIVAQAGVLPGLDGAKETMAEPVRGEQAMHVAAHDLAVGGYCAFISATQSQPGAQARVAPGIAHVHFVTSDCFTALEVNPLHRMKFFVGFEFGVHWQPPEAGLPGAAAFDTPRIANFTAKHLVATAKPKDPAAPTYMSVYVYIPAFLFEYFEIGNSRFGPRNNDEIGVAR